MDQEALGPVTVGVLVGGLREGVTLVLLVTVRDGSLTDGVAVPNRDADAVRECEVDAVGEAEREAVRDMLAPVRLWVSVALQDVVLENDTVALGLDCVPLMDPLALALPTLRDVLWEALTTLLLSVGVSVPVTVGASVWVRVSVLEKEPLPDAVTVGGVMLSLSVHDAVPLPLLEGLADGVPSRECVFERDARVGVEVLLPLKLSLVEWLNVTVLVSLTLRVDDRVLLGDCVPEGVAMGVAEAVALPDTMLGVTEGLPVALQLLVPE
jgi:hypothetical protein